MAEEQIIFLILETIGCILVILGYHGHCPCINTDRKNNMGLLSKIFGGVPKEKLKGIHLDTNNPYWEIDTPAAFEELFNSLRGWVPKGGILYFEGGSPDEEIINFISMYSVPEQEHVASGTIWPSPKVYHIPATENNLSELERIMKNHADPELAIHFHVYCGKSVIFEGHDICSQPILISGEISEKKVKILANRLGRNYRKII